MRYSRASRPSMMNFPTPHPDREHELSESRYLAVGLDRIGDCRIDGLGPDVQFQELTEYGADHIFYACHHFNADLLMLQAQFIAF